MGLSSLNTGKSRLPDRTRGLFARGCAFNNRKKMRSEASVFEVRRTYRKRILEIFTSIGKTFLSVSCVTFLSLSLSQSKVNLDLKTINIVKTYYCWK